MRLAPVTPRLECARTGARCADGVEQVAGQFAELGVQGLLDQPERFAGAGRGFRAAPRFRRRAERPRQLSSAGRARERALARPAGGPGRRRAMLSGRITCVEHGDARIRFGRPSTGVPRRRWACSSGERSQQIIYVSCLTQSALLAINFGVVMTGLVSRNRTSRGVIHDAGHCWPCNGPRVRRSGVRGSGLAACGVRRPGGRLLSATAVRAWPRIRARLERPDTGRGPCGPACSASSIGRVQGAVDAAAFPSAKNRMVVVVAQLIERQVMSRRGTDVPPRGETGRAACLHSGRCRPRERLPPARLVAHSRAAVLPASRDACRGLSDRDPPPGIAVGGTHVPGGRTHLALRTGPGNRGPAHLVPAQGFGRWTSTLG